MNKILILFAVLLFSGAVSAGCPRVVCEKETVDTDTTTIMTLFRNLLK